ncbi:MAG: glycerol-3-phosphate dehydrogenase [Pseudomonadota bacterium]
MLNAMDAVNRGATIMTRRKVISAERVKGLWQVVIQNDDGTSELIKAKVLVNAAGPWVSDVLQTITNVTSKKTLRLVKGSHILTPRLYSHDRAYIFQNTDGRIIFTIPYVNDTTLIGTTDEPFDGEPQDAAISEAEINYLCQSVSEYFQKPLSPDAIVGSFSGVRPLYDELGTDEASAVTRDYAFDIDTANAAPILSVYGGKLTTYRRLAEHALDQLSDVFPQMSKAWTKTASLPGGEGGYAAWERREKELKARYAFLSEDVFQRMVAAHGGNITVFLKDAQSCDDLGDHFGHGLYATEVNHMLEHEFVRTAEDLLLRRTKLGSLMTDDQWRRVQRYIDAHLPGRAHAA